MSSTHHRWRSDWRSKFFGPRSLSALLVPRSANKTPHPLLGWGTKSEFETTSSTGVGLETGRSRSHFQFQEPLRNSTPTKTKDHHIVTNRTHLARCVIVIAIAQLGSITGCATAKQSTEAAPKTNFKSVIAVASVVDQPAAVAWYKKCLGRDVDVTPAEGVAEWELAPNAWLQVTADPARAGKGSAIVVVYDLDAQRKTCGDAGISLGDTQDYGVVKLFEATDPEGNALVFVQEVAPPPQ